MLRLSGGRRPVLQFARLLGCLLVLHCGRVGNAGEEKVERDASTELPHIFISTLARNSAHLLPNFFGYLEALDYPKDKLSVWIRTDHNMDETATLVEEWCKAAKAHYSLVDCYTSKEWLYPTSDPFSTSPARYKNVATLRQAALDKARELGADYLFSVDVDCFLVNPQTLRLLVAQNKTLVAPMLMSSGKRAYSNFWMDQDSNGYYKRHEDYLPILKRERTGCFKAPVLLTAYLLHLTSSTEGLVYFPPPEGFFGPIDDVIQFAFSAKMEGVDMYVLNTEFFGYIVMPESYSSISDAANNFLYFKLKSLVNYPPVLSSQFISAPKKPRDNLGLDAVYMISLVRRTERRNRMIACLEELNFDYTLFDAVDGRELNDSYVEEQLGIHYMENWRDPWGNRTMTLGEVGCFLSHYTIWNMVLSEKKERVLILEDDIDFEPEFLEDLVEVAKEAEMYTPTWDLIYVGRKRIQFDEKKVKGAKWLVRPDYSYWTLGYLLSSRGARKLLDADPFQNFLPVDEYFPILFGKQPRKDWAKHYPHQTLEVYSAEPLLVYPTHYAGEEGWYSDTEPPVEILNQIRLRKIKEQEIYNEQQKVENQRKEKVKNKALQRQIEQLKKSMEAKSEL